MAQVFLGPLQSQGAPLSPTSASSHLQSSKESQVFMVVEDNNVVELGRAQRFTRLVKPKKERVYPPTAQPHASRGQGAGGGAF